MSDVAESTHDVDATAPQPRYKGGDRVRFGNRWGAVLRPQQGYAKEYFYYVRLDDGSVRFERESHLTPTHA